MSLRLSQGEEVLIVRVTTPTGGVGYGFTFSEDVAAARAMACWDAAARAVGRPLWQLLRDAPPADVAGLEAAVEPASHPWITAWRAMLAGSPGAHIDWTLEPGFTKLRWIDPEPRKENHDGRTAD